MYFEQQRPRTDPWRIPCFSVPQSEKMFSFIRWFYFNFLTSVSSI